MAYHTKKDGDRSSPGDNRETSGGAGDWRWLQTTAGLYDNFSRRQTLRFRIEEAKREIRGLDEQSKTQASSLETGDIHEHVETAENELKEGGPLETILRHVMAAERKLIAFLPDDRGEAAINDLRRDIDTYVGGFVTEERQAELRKGLDDAQAALRGSPEEVKEPAADDATAAPVAAPPRGVPPKQGASWRQHLLAVKVAVDEIVIGGYRTRERLRDGIALLGWGLFAINILLLLFVTIADSVFDKNIFDVSRTLDGAGDQGNGETGGTSDPHVSGGLVIWIGFFFGMVGACLSGLMNFAIHRIAPGEFETSAATIVRPLIGGTSGILGAALAASGILNFGDAVIPRSRHHCVLARI